MASFTIKNIPDELFEALKTRAANNMRSINQEAIHCLRTELARAGRTAEEAKQLLERLDRERA